MTVNLDAKETITYKKSYVAFLDVLGFTNMVKNEKHQKLEEYFGIVNSAIIYLQTISRKLEIGSIVISDSIILTIPHGNSINENIERLRSLSIAVGIIQQHLALKDIWIRGAISSGDTYFNSNKNQIVGPAFISAYLLEEKLAINPRVIIDSKIIKELECVTATELINQINKYSELDYDNWGKRIFFNWNIRNRGKVTDIIQDVPLFIDYLSPLVEKMSQEENALLIIKNIESNLYNNTNHYSKYRWVANYFTAVLRYGAEYYLGGSADAFYNKLKQL